MKIFKLYSIALLLTLTLFTTSNADDPSDTFNIMYVYTDAAKQRAGGTQNIISKIQAAVARINETFTNSNMDLQAKLVHIEEIYYPLDKNEWIDKETMENRFEIAVQHLIGKHDGYMDTVHSLRNTYQADIVQLIVANAAYGGLSYTMTNPDLSFESSALNVVGLKYINGSSVHELGHLLGICHTGCTGSHSYAHGYNIGDIGTVHGQNNIKYWSSPTLQYNGMILGDERHDARQAILENAPIFCNFRQQPIITPPSLIQNVPHEPLSTFDNSMSLRISGEKGYQVYIDGILKGMFNNDGYIDIVLSLSTIFNNFTITQKYKFNNVFSHPLNISITKIMDTDSDGIYDHSEIQFGLNPNSNDSDNDGYTDLEEYGDDLGPYWMGGVGGTATIPPKDTDGDGIIDALDEDSDNDGVSDKDERLASLLIPVYYIILN